MKSIISLLLIWISITGFGQSKKDKIVKISTTHGEMVAILYDETPLHKANFLKLAEAREYDSTIFHRVIEEFMIQGGNVFTKPGVEKKEQDDDRIPAEIIEGLFHRKGEIAAARTNNPEKKSSSCQFYIVHGKVYDKTDLMVDKKKLNKVFAELLQGGKIDSLRTVLVEMQKEGKFEDMEDFITRCAPYLEDISGKSLSLDKAYSDEQVKAYTSVGGSPHLDGEYTVFGRIISGIEVIDRIAAVETSRGDKPIEDIYMSMQVEELKKKKITKIYGYEYE